MPKTKYWLLNSKELKAYRERVQKRLELAEKIYKRYDRLLRDVNNQLEETELNEHKTEQWLQAQRDKLINDDDPTS